MNHIRNRSRRISFMPSGWIEQVELGTGAGGTVCLTIGCPDSFFAVRIGFPNLASEPWRLGKLFGRASTSFNDLVIPTGQTDWVPFCATETGNADDLPVVIDQPHEIIVRPRVAAPGAATAGVPRWTWTNWAPIASVEPDPESGLRVLMLRALLPSGQTVSYAVGEMRRWIGNQSDNKGFKCFAGGLKFDIDRGTEDVLYEPPRAWAGNNPVNGSMFPIVQFLTRNPGVTGILVGDSHQQGTSTTDQLTNFLFRAVTAAMPGYAGSVPLGYVNLAQGGSISSDFFERLIALIKDVRPSYVVLPGWTANDRSGNAQADQTAVSRFFGRLLLAAEICEAERALPIFLTPFPRDPGFMGMDRFGPWTWVREQILALRQHGAMVIDATPLLAQVENGIAFGTYKPEYSNDAMHPNDAGHQMVADLFQPLFEGLSRSPMDQT
jgi:hypothetical protein